MGAYICTISERDWGLARQLGMYGNRFYKTENGKALKDTQKLSIIRDIISVKEGDIIFFHIRGRKTIHGVYRARSYAFWDDTRIWDDPHDVFPCRFLFEPHPNHEKLCLYDAHISVHSLYELIDQGEIKSLVTLEFEQNIEARAVRRIFMEDAKKIIRLLYRDFKGGEKVDFDLYNPSNMEPLKDKVYRVGDLENAIKAVISWKLAYRDSEIVKLLELGEQYDFVNEFFVAPTTRKNIDLFCESSDKYIIIEVKKDICNRDALEQALYYADLVDQRPWSNKSFKKLVVLVGKRFDEDVKDKIKYINKINNTKVKLLKYVPINNGTWARLNEVRLGGGTYVQRTLFQD